ncbi:proteasome regulatory particle subunit [Saitoella coloradoensis]
MSDGTLRKADKDHSKILDEQLPEIEAQAASNIQSSLERLLSLEKQARQASDAPSVTRLLLCIARTLHAHAPWETLIDNILLLTKKHGQLKASITALVQESMKYITGSAPYNDKDMKMIDTLLGVTEGKIFVEVERARLTLMKSKHSEANDDIEKAASVLLDLQVESFGSMPPREKLEFILEQVRLCLARGDYDLAAITARKISTKQLETSETTDLRLRYYELVIRIGLHNDAYLDIAKHYRAVSLTDALPAQHVLETLQSAILFLILAPWDTESSSLLASLLDTTDIERRAPLYAELGRCFLRGEVMRWPLIEQAYGSTLRETAVFGAAPDGKGDARWDVLRERVTEHNIRTLAKYYTRLSLPRLSTLLDLPPAAALDALSRTVTSASSPVYARVDRPAGIVTFEKKKGGNEVLNEWSANVKSLLSTIGRVGELIGKEEALASVRKAKAANA